MHMVSLADILPSAVRLRCDPIEIATARQLCSMPHVVTYVCVPGIRSKLLYPQEV
jgi:hypothetical protein